MALTRRTQSNLLITFLLVVCFAIGCSRDNSSAPNNEMGRLLIRITDDPFPIDLVQEANVTINKIEIRRATEDSGTPFLILSEESRTFNLLDLQNDVTEVLVDLEIPTGSYDLLRLHVSEASIKLKDETNFDLKVPSGAQTGLKIFIEPAIDVLLGLTSELLLDFDVSKSFIVQGNPNTPAGIKGFNFKPVIRAVNMSTAGRITGLVTDTASIALENARVWIEQDSVISSAFTDGTGKYALIGILEGGYSVFATKTNYDTVSVSRVDVIVANKTTLDFDLTPQQ